MSLVCNHRRQFFRKFSGVVAIGATAPLISQTAHAELNEDRNNKRLSLYNRHTGERVKGVFSANGVLQQDVLNSFQHNLRDHRQNESVKMDIRLFDFLDQIQRRLGSDKEIHIISAFRSEKTNAMLASRSSAVAKKSFHMKGMAIDFAIPGIELKLIRDTAKSLKLGGVGYYPNSGFVHIDTGWVRSW
ncbi:DUF882 domain-containing protein [Thalassotalea sp. ND16A]|uniref:DUF882 domain-containing protein n=1 Tax=Thalassotalea sp. ND16A TaxID=1535422 RepID=UPI00051A197B|nr:DUF882 domain-containing protein [Thalassotalea sp. ND16A]KGJ87523.1 hypothetical protein ND16A_2906 [Thalassotalea sp. ND16A]